MAELQRTLEAMIAARFPTAPLRQSTGSHVDGLHRLSVAVVRANDVARAERVWHSVAASALGENVKIATISRAKRSTAMPC